MCLGLLHPCLMAKESLWCYQGSSTMDHEAWASPNNFRWGSQGKLCAWVSFVGRNNPVSGSSPSSMRDVLQVVTVLG